MLHMPLKKGYKIHDPGNVGIQSYTEKKGKLKIKKMFYIYYPRDTDNGT